MQHWNWAIYFVIQISDFNFEVDADYEYAKVKCFNYVIGQYITLYIIVGSYISMEYQISEYPTAAISNDWNIQQSDYKISYILYSVYCILCTVYYTVYSIQS